LTLPHSDLQADTLKARADQRFGTYRASNSVTVLEEVIGLYEEILRQRPVGHERRAESLNDLGDALYHFCRYHESDETRINRCIESFREGLLLRPPGHLLRDQSLHNLAKSLRFVLYPRLNRIDIVMEGASLNREALRLRPSGHPERFKSLGNLASDYRMIFDHTGDMAMRAQMVSMSREVLEMCPSGHQWRGAALNNLGSALIKSFEYLGSSDLLAEAIMTLHEAMQLRPIGHPLRFSALDNMASALSYRSVFEGHSESMLEAINLRREALQLLNENHSEGTRIINNLTDAMLDSFRNSGDEKLLFEAISLLRQLVALHMPERHGHDTTLENLAKALELKVGQGSDDEALREAADLHHDTLRLRPTGHPRRFYSMEGLARVLCKTESCPWPEALSYYQQALEICPVGYPARARLLSGMSRCFLEIGSPFLDLAKGISCLSEAYSDTYSHVNGRLKLAIPDLQRVEAAYSASAEGPDSRTDSKDAERVLDLYAQIIGLLPLAANFGLHHNARLQALAGYDAIARDAAARAVLLDITPQAVEMLEQGRGVFWMQTLHLRTSAFHGVPERDGQELERMLRPLEHGARRVELQEQSTVQYERELEQRRQLNEAVQALITKIRGYPGLDRFLLPPAFDTLFSSLPDGFVVIMNASHLGHHALLLHRATGLATSLALKLSGTNFDSAKLRDQVPRDMASGSEHNFENDSRAMRIAGIKTRCFEDVLSVLWTSAVQPVLEELRLNVS
jgi:tetratricopeptide (TPR) repeat protein